jgi:hypothetical protein
VVKVAVERASLLPHRHAPVALVIALGATVRLLTQVAYGPALYYTDSLAYLGQANGSLFSNPGQPAGYPLLIRLFRFGTAHLGVLTGAQHLAGLATALIVYVVVWRGTGRKGLGTLGCALVVLDGYEITVEQYVMSDAFFALLVTASAALVLQVRRQPLVVVASGILLASACLVRPVGIFCIPVWLAYVLWRHRWSFTTLLSVAAVLFPLLGYAAVNDAKTGHFALTDDTAWLLYARIGSIGDCRGLSIPADEQVLCPHGTQLGQSVAFYLYTPESPAVRAFGPPAVRAPANVDRLLLGYAVRVMSQRPLRYVGLVAGSVLDFFLAGTRSDYALENYPITLPRPGPWIWPTYRPRQSWPASILRAYVELLHTCRPLLGIFVLLGILGLSLRPATGSSRGYPPRSGIALLQGMGLALLLGAALSHFELRYELPAVPLLTSGGILAAYTVWQRRMKTDAEGAPCESEPAPKTADIQRAAALS